MNSTEQEVLSPLVHQRSSHIKACAQNLLVPNFLYIELNSRLLYFIFLLCIMLQMNLRASKRGRFGKQCLNLEVKEMAWHSLHAGTFCGCFFGLDHIFEGCS